MRTFRPSEHGWPFGNSFKYKVPILHTTIDAGFCGGMCRTALDRFYSRIPIPRNLSKPTNGDPLYNEIRKSQEDSLPASTLLRMYEWQQSPDMGHRLNPHHSLGHRTLQEWPSFEESLTKGDR